MQSKIKITSILNQIYQPSLSASSSNKIRSGSTKAIYSSSRLKATVASDRLKSIRYTTCKARISSYSIHSLAVMQAPTTTSTPVRPSFVPKRATGVMTRKGSVV